MKPLIKAWLPREAFTYKDKGVIMIENKASEAIQVKVFCEEAFVNFSKTVYVVEKQLQIPFIIKLPTLLSAQLLFSRIPSLSAKIEVIAVLEGKQFKKNLNITAGEW